MAFNWEIVGDKIFGILASAGYGIQMRDDKGQATSDPHKATRFLATIKCIDSETETYNVLIGVHDEGSYSHLDFRTPNSISDKDFKAISKIKDSIQTNLGDIEGLKINWTPFGSKISLKDDPVKTISESKDISKVYGTTKSSFQKVGESKLIIRHTDSIDESKKGSRWRKIRAVFIETKAGERFKYQHPHISGARAIARHLSEGGSTNDLIGRGIANLSDDYMHLKHANGLLRHAGKQDYSMHIKGAMKDINHDLRRLSGPRGYKSANSLITKPGNDIDATDKLSKQLLIDCNCTNDSDKLALETAARYLVSKDTVPDWLEPMLYSLRDKLNDQDSIDKIMDILRDISKGKIPNVSQIKWVTDLAKEFKQNPEVDRIKQLSGI